MTGWPFRVTGWPSGHPVNMLGEALRAFDKCTGQWARNTLFKKKDSRVCENPMSGQGHLILMSQS